MKKKIVTIAACIGVLLLIGSALLFSYVKFGTVNVFANKHRRPGILIAMESMLFQKTGKINAYLCAKERFTFSLQRIHKEMIVGQVVYKIY